jgi:hypothetical protein
VISKYIQIVPTSLFVLNFPSDAAVLDTYVHQVTDRKVPAELRTTAIVSATVNSVLKLNSKISFKLSGR